MIYKNASGDEMELKCSSGGTKVINGKVGEVEYSTETFETKIYSETDLMFNITIKGSGNPAADRSQVVKSLLIMLMPFAPGGNLFLSIQLKDGGPANDLITPPEITSLELLGRTFERVFMEKQEDSDRYSEIYFSPIDGVIAFRDGDDELWVLDEVVE